MPPRTPVRQAPPDAEIPAESLGGHALERANVCAWCRRPLRSGHDGHYHTATVSEPVCCDCATRAGHRCPWRKRSVAA